MIGLPAGTRIWLAVGVTDMRSGMNGLATRVQTALAEDPFSGHVFLFRGRRGDMIKVLWWSGDGMCLLAKRGLSEISCLRHKMSPRSEYAPQTEIKPGSLAGNSRGTA
jgi:transposase